MWGWGVEMSYFLFPSNQQDCFAVGTNGLWRQVNESESQCHHVLAVTMR